MVVTGATLISPSLGLIIGTFVGIGWFGLMGWLVLLVIPRHLTIYARQRGARR